MPQDGFGSLWRPVLTLTFRRSMPQDGFGSLWRPVLTLTFRCSMPQDGFGSLWRPVLTLHATGRLWFSVETCADTDI
ncbi:hypothetical protein ACOMHN_000193 [Nucella lapillus]